MPQSTAINTLQVNESDVSPVTTQFSAINTMQEMKTGFLDLPGEIRNKIYRLASPPYLYYIKALSEKNPAAIRRHYHPLAEVHPLITTQWNRLQFENTTLLLPYFSSERDETEQVWDTWIQDHSLTEAAVKSIERFQFNMRAGSFKLQIQLLKSGPRRIKFEDKIQWSERIFCLSGSNVEELRLFERQLQAQLRRRFLEIETECKGPFGKDELTRIRDVAFDAMDDVFVKVNPRHAFLVRHT